MGSGAKMSEMNNGPETLKGEDWAGEMGAKWLANLACFEGMIAPIGEALLKQADFKPGERVLDIGSSRANAAYLGFGIGGPVPKRYG
jgi:hypothetical protein